MCYSNEKLNKNKLSKLFCNTTSKIQKKYAKEYAKLSFFCTYPSIGPAEQLQGGSRPRSSNSCI